MNPRLRFLLVSFTLWIVVIYSFQPLAKNPLKSFQTSLNRTRRYLVFVGGGTFKPLTFMDKHPYRQLALSYGFHVQFTLATSPMYWWTYFTNSTAWAPSESAFNPAQSRNHKHSYNHNPQLRHYGTFVQKNYRQPAIIYDYSRSFIYKAFEALLSSKGLPGERCVLRAICEVAQRPLTGNNFIERIFNSIFRPTVANINSKYLHAKNIGTKGIECGKFYWGCNKVTEWLKQFENYI